MNIHLLCNFNILNFVLKTNGAWEGDTGVGVQNAQFCYFLIWGALILGRWNVMGQGRKSYLERAEIKCLCLFKGVRVSPKFPYVIQRRKDFP